MDQQVYLDFKVIHISVVEAHMIDEDVKHNSMEHDYNFMVLPIMDDVVDFLNVVDVKLLFELLVELELLLFNCWEVIITQQQDLEIIGVSLVVKWIAN